ncbi:MAG: PEP-CTERM sorting domain-containing protein [Candidatus Ancaeobacter aquaticus]|nr:PEP-CTERM sorting domain-containing protein [Candidatus Ancaeobacter aquaticus]
MKKLFILISMAVFVGITSPLYAITILEDFDSYGSGTIIDGSGGTNWGTNWTGSGSPTFVGDSGSGKLTASGAGDNVYRAFTTALTSIDANGITIEIKQSGASFGGGGYGSFFLGDSVGTKGIMIGFVSTNPMLNIRGITDSADPSSGTDISIFSNDSFYNIIITEVDFDNNRYKARVDDGPVSNYIDFVNNVSNFQTLGVYQYNTSNPTYFDDISISGVPEPSTYALFGIGLLGFFGGWIRKKAVSCKH